MLVTVPVRPIAGAHDRANGSDAVTELDAYRNREASPIGDTPDLFTAIA